MSIAMFLLACFFATVVAVRADSDRTRSLDRELLERLSVEPLEDLDRELFAPDKESLQGPQLPGRVPEGPGTDADAWERQLLRELGAAATPEEENPLWEIARQMRQVEGLIAQAESGPKTQNLQRQIVARLEELIKQARSSCQKCSPSQSSPKVAVRRQVRQPKKKPGQGKPGQKPAANPAAKPAQAAPSKRLTLDQFKALIKSVWGELPEAQREQMLQWAGEEFLPKYELLIELYFRRLAEQRGRAGN